MEEGQAMLAIKLKISDETDEDQVQEEGSQKDQIHQTKSASFSRITSYLAQTPTITNISLIPDAVNNALRNAE